MIQSIREIIQKAVEQDVNFDIAVPPDQKLGDYATNVAFPLSKIMRQAPLDITREIVDKIKAVDKNGFFETVVATPPGFINIKLSQAALGEELQLLLKSKKKYGSQSAKKQKIHLEFLSANPTGPLTLANGRGGFYGDVLANIFKFSGYPTYREYYVNDAGNQIRVLGESILARLNIIPMQEIYYQGNYVGELALKIKNKLQKILLSENPLIFAEEIGQMAAKELLNSVKKSTKRANIVFNRWLSEQKEIRTSGLLSATLEALRLKNSIVEKDGAVFLKTSEMPLEEMVLIKSTKEPTYLLTDTAYHYHKLIKRKFDLAIDVWGADHHGYAKKLNAALGVLGLNTKKFKVIITQLVRLVEGGQEVRMSKRKGEFITFDEVIDKVGVPAMRFIFLLHSLDSHMDFDWALAQQKTLENPVYYFQYSYVRALKILEKAKIKPAAKKFDIKLVNSTEELLLLKELIQFPDIISDIAKNYQVHLLPQYALKVCKAFNIFYEKQRVIDAPEPVRSSRLVLIIATKQILENCARLLGIEMPKEM